MSTKKTLTLALLLAVSRDELEADFAQYYGLDLGGMGTEFAVSHAAVLATQLPPHSRCAIKANFDASWSDETAMLEAIDYHLQHLMWMLSDIKTRGEAPKPPKTPSQLKALGNQIEEAQLNRSEVDRILGIGPS